MRLRNPTWFGKYNYIVGGGLDAGAKIAMFILTFAVAGGSGNEVPFPTVSPIHHLSQFLNGRFLTQMSLLSGGETPSPAGSSMPTTAVPGYQLQSRHWSVASGATWLSRDWIGNGLDGFKSEVVAWPKDALLSPSLVMFAASRRKMLNRKAQLFAGCLL